MDSFRYGEALTIISDEDSHDISSDFEIPASDFVMSPNTNRSSPWSCSFDKNQLSLSEIMAEEEEIEKRLNLRNNKAKVIASSTKAASQNSTNPWGIHLVMLF